MAHNEGFVPDDCEKFIAIDGNGHVILNFAKEPIDEKYPFKEFKSSIEAETFMETEGHENYKIFKQIKK